MDIINDVFVVGGLLADGESSAGDGSCRDRWKDQRFGGFVPPTIRYEPCIIFVIG